MSRALDRGWAGLQQVEIGGGIVYPGQEGLEFLQGTSRTGTVECRR